jgi:hypothetical protein
MGKDSFSVQSYYECLIHVPTHFSLGKVCGAARYCIRRLSLSGQQL